MLKGIPKIISPELLGALCELGHSDVVILADGNFPIGMFGKQRGVKTVRADGLGIPAMLDAILQLMPLDSYCEKPLMLMQKMACDEDMDILIWEEYKNIIRKYDERGEAAIGYYDRFAFYEAAKQARLIVYTGEEAVYANVMLQKGVVKNI
jgi:L-fucose mutarotase